MKKIMILLFIFFIGCKVMIGNKIKDVYLVRVEKNLGDNMIIPRGYESFFVYGGEIAFLSMVRVFEDGTYELKCIDKMTSFCNFFNDEVKKTKESGIVYRKPRPITSAEQEEIKNPDIYTCDDSGELRRCVKKIVQKEQIEPKEYIFSVIEKMQYKNNSQYSSYRLIFPQIGEKYLAANQSAEMHKNELWNAIIWNPDDIVKERMSDGTYIYKDDIAANKAYNPWRKK